MYRIKNTAEDRTKHLLHRTAAKFELEPALGGVRIRLGSFVDITDEHYERVKPLVDEWVKKGMVEVVDLDSSENRLSKWKAMEPHVQVAMEQEKKDEFDANGLKLGGPTLEEWMTAGYPAEAYPPTDFAETPSPGLTSFRMEQERVKNEVAALEAAKLKQEMTPVTAPEVPMAQTIVEPIPVVPPIPASPPVFNKQQDPNKNKKLR